jgi:hypothetical protein
MKIYVKIALGVVLLLVIVIIGVALYYYNLKPKDLREAKPDFFLSATELQQAFDLNEADATTKYVNKVIEVTGEILSARPGEKGSYNIALKTGNESSMVNCNFPVLSDPEAFHVGDSITLRGVCSGYLMDVLLNNCVAVK